MDTSNKKIALNTIVVYVRIFITMVIGLLTSRFVLQALGASDFGLYNVVGGVIAMLSFISSSLAASTTRFLNYEMGKPDGNTNRVFNVSLLIHAAFMLIILVLAETIGVFYILEYLNVEPGKEADSMFVYQVSTIVACIGLFNIPYQSLFIAHEKFTAIAIIDIINSIIKLVMVLCLLFFKGNALRFYALSMSLMTLFSFAAYHLLAKKYWPDTIKYSFIRCKKYYKDILVFNNYNLLGTVSLMVRNQGSNMLINFFFGTTVNAAYAIGNTVMNYVNMFVANFDTAAGPQITQNISAGNRDRYMSLCSMTCRMCILLMIVVFFPLISELDFILHAWLGSELPEYTEIFCKCTLWVAVISATSGGITQLINGLGKIKWFKIEISVLFVMCIPIGYLLCKNDYPSYYIILLFIASDIINRVIQLLLLRKIDGLDIMHFVKQAYLRPSFVFIIMYCILSIYEYMQIEQSIARIAGVAIIFLLSGVICLFVGLTTTERSKIIPYIINKIK